MGEGSFGEVFEVGLGSGKGRVGSWVHRMTLRPAIFPQPLPASRQGSMTTNRGQERVVLKRVKRNVKVSGGLRGD
jgi:hypothetical protein